MPENADPSLVREVALSAPCPMCGAEPLRMRTMSLDIPYFGDALQTTVLCEACGFRHADVLHTKQGEPTRHSLRIRAPEDLNARVIRSASCTVRVPELGAVIEPGPQGEAFISNAEGVLHRFRDVYGFLVRHADTERARRRAAKALEILSRMIDGREPFTLVLEDPFGNSAILHDAAEVRALTEQEVARLKTGTFTIEVSRAGRRAPASP